jgi:hypothetical protein
VNKTGAVDFALSGPVSSPAAAVERYTRKLLELDFDGDFRDL